MFYDFSFFLDKGLTYGLLSSNRDGGKGEDDIYGFNIDNRNKLLYVNGVDDYYTVLKGDTLKVGGNGVLDNDISSNSSSNIFNYWNSNFYFSLFRVRFKTGISSEKH